MKFNPSRPYDSLPSLPPPGELETKPVLKACVEARSALASLKQATALIPDPSVLINTIPLLEAQASSAIENIVTTTDALFRLAQLNDNDADPATKEALRSTCDYFNAILRRIDGEASRGLRSSALAST